MFARINNRTLKKTDETPARHQHLEATPLQAQPTSPSLSSFFYSPNPPTLPSTSYDPKPLDMKYYQHINMVLSRARDQLRHFDPAGRVDQVKVLSALRRSCLFLAGFTNDAATKLIGLEDRAVDGLARLSQAIHEGVNGRCKHPRIPAGVYLDLSDLVSFVFKSVLYPRGPGVHIFPRDMLEEVVRYARSFAEFVTYIFGTSFPVPMQSDGSGASS